MPEQPKEIKQRGIKTEIIHQRLLNDDEEQRKNKLPTYYREAYRTYLTAPEWRNVEMAEEVAAFLESGKPFYRFPYFSQILTFWKVFFLSLRAAHKKHNWFELLTSEYMVMNTFIGVLTTVGFVIKGFVSLPFRFLWRSENNTPFQKVAAKHCREYSDFIQHTPFFLYPYLSKIKPLWQAYWHSSPKTVTDTVTLLMATFEYVIRTIPALPSRMMYSQNASNEAANAVSTEASTIKMLVKHRRDDKALLLRIAELLDDGVLVNPTRPHLDRSFVSDKPFIYATVNMPRYAKFKLMLERMADLNSADAKRNFVIKKIAGQDEILVDVECASQLLPWLSKEIGPRLLYTYQNYVDNNCTVAMSVKTTELLDMLRKNGGAGSTSGLIKIKRIHDF